MQTLFHLYAVNRDGVRVTPTETETDRQLAARKITDRNRHESGRARWVAIEVDRASGRRVRADAPVLV